MKGFPAQPARDAVTAMALTHQVTVAQLALSLGIHRSTLQRLYTRSHLRYDAADHIAVTLGRHPSELWPDWFGPHLCQTGTTGTDDALRSGQSARDLPTAGALPATVTGLATQRSAA